MTGGGHRSSMRGPRVLGWVGLAVAAVSSAAATPLAHREVLPGGTVLLVAERPAIPVVAVTVYVRAGSVYDPPDLSGLAHLAAALLTRGTTRRSAPEIDRAIEFVGGGLEAEASREGVSISVSILRKDLELGLELLAEVITQPAFPEDEFKREVADVQAALRRADQDPETVASWELARLLYPGHPYAHPVSGTVESVGRLTREQVVRFHGSFYRPDTAIVVAAGAVTREDIRRWFLTRLAGWTPPPGSPPAIPEAALNPPVQSRFIPRELTQSTILLGRPAVRQHHPDYLPLLVANQVLGGTSSSRIYRRVRDERGLAYSVESWVAPARHGSAVAVSLQTRIDGAREAVQLVKEEMKRLAEAPVPAEELEVAKSYLVGSFPLRLDTTAKTAQFLAAVEEAGLGLDYPERYKAGIGGVTAADVQRVSAIYFDPATFSEVTVGKLP
jgi:zinc protease